MQVKVDVSQMLAASTAARTDATAAPGRIKSGLEQRASGFVSTTKRTAPRRTGKLANSIAYRQVPAASGSVTFEASIGVNYGPYVVEGTAPHIIRPRNGRVLAFPGGGGTVFARVVHHPGTHANPFWDEAFDDASQQSQFEPIADTLTTALKGP